MRSGRRRRTGAADRTTAGDGEEEADIGLRVSGDSRLWKTFRSPLHVAETCDMALGRARALKLPPSSWPKAGSVHGLGRRWILSTRKPSVAVSDLPSPVSKPRAVSTSS